MRTIWLVVVVVCLAMMLGCSGEDNETAGKASIPSGPGTSEETAGSGITIPEGADGSVNELDHNDAGEAAAIGYRLGLVSNFYECKDTSGLATNLEEIKKFCDKRNISTDTLLTPIKSWEHAEELAMAVLKQYSYSSEPIYSRRAFLFGYTVGSIPTMCYAGEGLKYYKLSDKRHRILDSMFDKVVDMGEKVGVSKTTLTAFSNIQIQARSAKTLGDVADVDDKIRAAMVSSVEDITGRSVE